MARRDAALRAMRDHDISQRRACALVGVDPKTVRRERSPDNPEIRKEMGKIAETRRRFGYRRIGILLERKGITMNHKKLYRLYREEGLSVRCRRGRKRARGSRSPMPQALRPNQRWSMDFVSDTFGASRRFRILAVNGAPPWAPPRTEAATALDAQLSARDLVIEVSEDVGPAIDHYRRDGQIRGAQGRDSAGGCGRHAAAPRKPVCPRRL